MKCRDNNTGKWCIMLDRDPQYAFCCSLNSDMDELDNGDVISINCKLGKVVLKDGSEILPGEDMFDHEEMDGNE
jgi:hypothetical protein